MEPSGQRPKSLKHLLLQVRIPLALRFPFPLPDCLWRVMLHFGYFFITRSISSEVPSTLSPSTKIISVSTPNSGRRLIADSTFPLSFFVGITIDKLLYLRIPGPARVGLITEYWRIPKFLIPGIQANALFRKSL